MYKRVRAMYSPIPIMSNLYLTNKLSMGRKNMSDLRWNDIGAEYQMSVIIPDVSNYTIIRGFSLGYTLNHKEDKNDQEKNQNGKYFNHEPPV